MIGEIIKPHGVHGEIRVEPYTDDPERFELLDHVFVGNPPQRVGVESVRYHQGLILLKLAGDVSRNEAELRRGQRIYITEDQAVPLEEGEYFLHDLFGLEVVTEDGRVLGELTEVLETGANNVFVVKGDDGELLLPDIPDVIVDIDFEQKRLTVRLMEGLAAADSGEDSDSEGE